MDPILIYLINKLGSSLYNYEEFKLLLPGFLLHFFLWLLYGIAIDNVIKNVLIVPNK